MNRLLVTSFMMILFLLPATASFAAEQEPVIRSCVVEETLDNFGYTYIRCKERGVDIWVATIRTTLRIGEQIAFADAPPMVNFTSEGLKRTLPQVIFVTGIERNDAQPDTMGDLEPKGYTIEDPPVTGTDDNGTLIADDRNQPQ